MTTATRERTNHRLYPYQEEDVEQLIARPRLILGSVMRAGKMVETFELVKRLNLSNILVVCPKNMVPEWLYAMDDWSIERSRFDVINYEKLRRSEIISLIQKAAYEMLVFDECHYLKNRNAQQTKGAILIAPFAPRVILASGTPLQNDPRDLFPLLHIIDSAAFPSFSAFDNRYCYYEQLPRPPFPRIFVSAKNKVELRELLGRYMLRREKEELVDWEGRRIVLERMPTHTIPIELDNKQLENYLTMEDELFAILDSGEKVTAPKTIAQIMRLRQICLDPHLLSPSLPLTSSTSAKTRMVLTLADGAGGPLIVYTYFETYARILKEELDRRGISNASYTGQTKGDENRHHIVEEFREGKYKVLIGTIKTMGLGLNLTASHEVVFTDYWWNPAVNDQAASRAEGTGQVQPLEISELWAIGTIEDHMRRVLKRKEKMSEEIVLNETINSMRKAREGKNG